MGSAGAARTIASATVAMRHSFVHDFIGRKIVQERREGKN